MWRFTTLSMGCRRLACLGIWVGSMVAQANAGTVTYVSQERRVVASASYGVPDITDTRSADDFSPFNETASADVSEGVASVRSSASMNSTLGQNGLFFSGNLAYDIENAPDAGALGRVSYEVGIAVVFSIDQPYAFDFDFTTVENATDASGEGTTEFRFDRLDGDGGPAFPVVAEHASGVMAPGAYALNFGKGAESIGSSLELRSSDIDYDIALRLTPTGGGGEPNPIPLPPAVWPGLALIGAIAFHQLRKRAAAGVR